MGRPALKLKVMLSKPEKENNHENIILALALMLSACTVTHGSFTVMSNKIVDIKNFDLGKSERIKGVTGENMEHIIIFIPTGVPSITNALNDAFDKTDTDIMTDVTLKSWYWYIPYIYGNAGWEVSGDAIKTRRN